MRFTLGTALWIANGDKYWSNIFLHVWLPCFHMTNRYGFIRWWFYQSNISTKKNTSVWHKRARESSISDTFFFFPIPPKYIYIFHGYFIFHHQQIVCGVFRSYGKNPLKFHIVEWCDLAMKTICVIFFSLVTHAEEGKWRRLKGKHQLMKDLIIDNHAKEKQI